jgi:hypothetical protein
MINRSPATPEDQRWQWLIKLVFYPRGHEVGDINLSCDEGEETLAATAVWRGHGDPGAEVKPGRCWASRSAFVCAAGMTSLT